MSILWHRNTDEEQTTTELSHVGGYPRLPASLTLPSIAETGDPMTFFFSIDLSFIPALQGRVLSVFAATTWFDENDCIPQMFGANTRGYDVPLGALDSYQRQFKLFITAARVSDIRRDYTPRIRYNVLHESDSAPENATCFGERDSEPRWLLDDETPGTYGGRERFVFLFQTKENYRFSMLPGAPHQMLPDYTALEVGRLIPRKISYYDLWAANAAYFFSTQAGDVLVVPQSD